MMPTWPSISWHAPLSAHTFAARDLLFATLVFAGAITFIPPATPHFPQLLVRWLAGGIAVLAAAEIMTASLALLTAAGGVSAPQLFHSPYRSTSVSEFWTKRWNVGASVLFRKFCFEPIARRHVALALFATFLVSAVAHFILAYSALGDFFPSFACGAFFLVQPALILVERRLRIRLWRPLFAWGWTFGVLALMSPLFVEPVLRIIESSYEFTAGSLWPTAAMVTFAILFSSFITLASLAALPAECEDAEKSADKTCDRGTSASWRL
jgi:hypothetical protein